MRLSRSFLIAFCLALSPGGATAFAEEDAAPARIEPILKEREEKRLIQFEVRIARKGAPVRGITADDLDIELGGKPLKNFAMDDMCADPSVVAFEAPATRPGSSIFYFDEPELTLEGRMRAVEVARRVAPALLARGHDLLILRNGAAVRAETKWTHDAAEVSAALDRIASDPGGRDYLRDASDEEDVERLIDHTRGLRGDGAITIILTIGLAPADDASIGCDADEHKVLSPPGMDRKALDTRDLH